MQEYEYIVCCLLIPIAYVIVYISGKYDVIGLAMKQLADSVENINRKKAYDENALITSNGDRIRNMSDEELTNILLEFDEVEMHMPFCGKSSRCEEILDAGETIPDEMCRECMLKWLKAECNND